MWNKYYNILLNRYNEIFTKQMLLQKISQHMPSGETAITNSENHGLVELESG
jgi:hypothetical protein